MTPRAYGRSNEVAWKADRRVMTFMAECFWPGVTAQKVADAGERVRQASRSITSADGLARYLGSILVPSDEIALCIFEATSIDVAMDVNQRAAIPSERILEIVRVGFRPSARDLPPIRQRSFDEPSR